jgi:uncharacterized protein (TIGR02246 family)
MNIDSSTIDAFARAYADAWSSKSPEAVASFFAADGTICINRGDVLKGRAAIAQMAAAFYADLPDMIVRCDGARPAGSHAILLWTFEGHHARTRNRVCVSGWEEWELDSTPKISVSLGWYDAADYARQIEGR